MLFRFITNESLLNVLCFTIILEFVRKILEAQPGITGRSTFFGHGVRPADLRLCWETKRLSMKETLRPLDQAAGKTVSNWKMIEGSSSKSSVRMITVSAPQVFLVKPGS